MPLAKNVMKGGVSAGAAQAINGNASVVNYTAAGTTQSDATPILADTNIITTATSGQGVIVYNGQNGDDQLVFNDTLVDIKVYPPTDAAFNQLSANSAFTLASYTGVICKKISSTQWLGFLSA
jgi:hypothetical protein